MRVLRLPGNPIIRPGIPGFPAPDHRNINGPSLIRTPEWLPGRIARYYLYFAHHGGTYIRLAVADRLEGPWHLHPHGTLKLSRTPCHDHIASPDVHVCTETKRVLMYFHGTTSSNRQETFLAESTDGIDFTVASDALGPPYFRVFYRSDGVYALAMADTGPKGITLYRSETGVDRFEEGPSLVPDGRHAAIHAADEIATLWYSRVGESPERIWTAEMALTGDWRNWRLRDEEVLLEPETTWEGVRLPLKPSRYGAAPGSVRQLRDPAFFLDEDEPYILYSVAGESGLALGRLDEFPSAGPVLYSTESESDGG